MKILYVDDEPALLELGKDFLELEEDISVVITTSPRQALKDLGSSSVDVIVSDYMMPEMDGLEFFRRLRSQGNTLPFILFTGKGREEVVMDAMRIGIDFYVKKGGDAQSQFAELVNAIRQSVARRDAEQALEHNARRFRTMIENQSDIITVCGPDGTITYVSASVQKVLGYRPEEMIGTKVGSYLYQDDVCPFNDQIGELYRQPNRSFHAEVRLTHRDGSLRHIDVDGKLLIKDNAPSEIVINAHDITDRKNGEKRIQHLINVLKAIREVNKRITTESDPVALMRSVCDVLVQRGYSTAWAILYEESDRPAMYAEAGLGDALDLIRDRIDSGDPIPCVRQMMAGEPYYMEDDRSMRCDDCPVANHQPDRVRLAKPLSFDGKLFGQLSVSLRSELYSTEELSLLDEIAGDLSYALHHLQSSQERDEIRRTMSNMKRRFTASFINMSDPTLVIDKVGDQEGKRLDYIMSDSSSAFKEVSGELAGRSLRMLIHEESEALALYSLIDKVLETRVPMSLELMSRNNGKRYAGFLFSPVKDYAAIMLLENKTASGIETIRFGQAPGLGDTV